MTTNTDITQERADFEAAYAAAYPVAASRPDKFDREDWGDYVDASVGIGWRLWQAGRAAVQANSLSADDLADIDDALANLIQDKRDYCPHEDGTAEQVARLEALRQRLTHGGNCAAVEADRQSRMPSNEEIEACGSGGPMSLVIALDFAENPRPFGSLAAPADTNGELYKALRVLAAEYRALVAEADALLSGQPAASPEPSGYAYRYPDGIRFNDGREVNGCKPTETLPYWFGAAPVAQEPVAEVLSSRKGNDTSTIDKTLPDGTKLYAWPVAAQAQPIQWPTMPPRKGQSPVLFDDGYAEGWAKCMSECQKAVAAQAQPVAFAKDGVLFWHGGHAAWRGFSGDLYLAAQAQPTIRESLKVAQDHDAGLADTQRAIIEAAERRGYARAEAENVGYRTDAGRYREFFEAGLPITFLGIDYHDKPSLDAAIDAARAAKGADHA